MTTQFRGENTSGDPYKEIAFPRLKFSHVNHGTKVHRQSSSNLRRELNRIDASSPYVYTRRGRARYVILLNQRSYINKGRALYKYVLLCFAYVIFERISLALFDKEAEIEEKFSNLNFLFRPRIFSRKPKTGSK